MSTPELPSAATVAEGLEAVRERIRAVGGEPEDRWNRSEELSGPTGVRIIAVTKGFGAAAVRAALDAGLEVCGENYAQELVAKSRELSGPGGRQPRWHMIGRLQSNKVRSLAGLVDTWQSVDRLSLGREIARRCPGARVMVQCDLSGEASKGGAALHDVAGLVTDLRDLGLEVSGLMGMGPMGEPEAARPGFRDLVSLADELGLAQRSMGMSADLEVAVEEGATMVRVGTALFGERTARPAPDH